MPKPEPDKLWEGQVNVDPRPVPSPRSLPWTALQAPNRNLATLGRSRLCEYFFGMREVHGCNFGDQCFVLPIVCRNWACLMKPLTTDGQRCGTMAKWTSGFGTLSFAPQTLRGGSSVPSHMKGVTPKLWFLIGHGAWPSTAAYCHMSLCLCMCHLTTIGLGSKRHGAMA